MKSKRAVEATCDDLLTREQARLRALAEVDDAVTQRESQTLRLRKLRLDRDQAERLARQRASQQVVQWLSGAQSSLQRKVTGPS